MSTKAHHNLQLKRKSLTEFHLDYRVTYTWIILTSIFKFILFLFILLCHIYPGVPHQCAALLPGAPAPSLKAMLWIWWMPTCTHIMILLFAEHTTNVGVK